MAYRENIDAFVAATNKKEKVFCSAEAFGRFKEDKPLPLSLPRVSFALAKALSDSQEKKMMTSLGDTSEKKKAGKKVVEVKKTKAKEIAPPADFDDTFGNLFA